MSTALVIPHNRTVYTEKLIHLIECARCSIDFGIGDNFMARRREDHQNFYCPNGHSNVYNGDDTKEQLRKAKIREQQLADQLTAATHDAEATRQALIRDRHRFANGVCPCCNRSFDNVRRHMSTQHPDYDVAKVDAAAARTMYGCSCGREFRTPHGLAIHQGRSRRSGWDSPATSRWYAHLTVVPS